MRRAQPSRGDRTERTISSRFDRNDALAVAVLVSLAAALRFAALGGQSYWSDEAVTVSLVSKGFADMLAAIPHTESTPPLYYSLAWLWSRLFGTGEVGLRSLSVLAGTITVPFVYAAARLLAGRAAGVAAAALVAVNPLLVWYSQEARSYALLTALVSISFFSFVLVLDRPSGRRLVAWTLVSALAIATHYFAAFVVVPEALWLIVRWRSTRVSLAVCGLFLAGIALVPLAAGQRGTGNGDWVARTPLVERIVNLAKEFLVGRNAPHDRLLAFAVAVSLAACFVGLRGSRSTLASLMPAAVIGVASLAMPLGLAVAGLDYLSTQNAIGALIPLTAAFGVAIGALPRLMGAVALTVVGAAAISVMVSVARNPAYQRTDWRSAAEAIDTTRRKRIVIAAPDYGGSFARLPLSLYLSNPHAIDAGDVKPTMVYRYLAARGCDDRSTRKFRVDEIVVATLGVHADVHLPTSFRLVEKRDDVGFDLRRYRSDRPVAVTAHQLVPQRPEGGTDVAVLLEQPSKSASQHCKPSSVHKTRGL